MADGQNTPDHRVLQGLYQHWLQTAVNLTEENARLQVRIAELEQAQDQEVGA